MNKDLRNRFIMHKNIIDRILNDELGLSYGMYKELFDLNSKNIPLGYDKTLYKQQVSYETFEDAVKDLGLIPITTKTNKVDKLLVVDKVILTDSYKELSEDEIKSKLESEYGFKIFLIDSSRQNTMQSTSEKSLVYFV